MIFNLQTFFFFEKVFQPMASAPDDTQSLLSDQDINWFLV